MNKLSDITSRFPLWLGSKQMANGQKSTNMWGLLGMVPGHKGLQASFWMAWPSQMAPPLRGAGLVQLRVLFWKPFPQRLLHTDHSVHVDQPPFTTTAKYSKNRKFWWINFKCLAVSNNFHLLFIMHFFLWWEQSKKTENVFCCSGYLCTIAMAPETMAKSISLITAQETAAGKHIVALDF